MKRAELCRCGRPKSEHYAVTIRRKRRQFADCKKFRRADGPPGQLILTMPDADQPQSTSNQKNS